MRTTPRQRKSGFTVVEVMVSLVILAMLLTAVAFAFDASVTNFKVNKGIYETVNRSRQALLRITNDLRTAQDIPLPGEEPNTQVSFGNDTDGDGIYDKDVTYRFDNSTTPGVLYYDDNLTGTSHVLCENVVSATFERTQHEVEREGVDIWAVRDVRIVLTLTDEAGEVTQTLAAATLVRKNL